MSMICNVTSSTIMQDKLASLKTPSVDDQACSEIGQSFDKESCKKLNQAKELKKGESAFISLPELLTLPDYSKANEINKEILARERSKYYERKAANDRAYKHMKEAEHDAVLMCTTGHVKPKGRVKKKKDAFLCDKDGTDQQPDEDQTKRPSSRGDGEATPTYTQNVPAHIRHQIPKLAPISASFLDGQPVINEVEKQRLLKFPQRGSNNIPTPDLKNGPYTPFEMLCSIQRRNVLPGVEKPVTLSWTKTVYNKEVFERRYPETDKYRYKRDHLSTWAEHNVLRQRMKKAWKEHNDRKMAARGETVID